jgi:hypothetical protein
MLVKNKEVIEFLSKFKCTCYTHAQEKVCHTKCDNPTNNKPLLNEK